MKDENFFFAHWILLTAGAVTLIYIINALFTKKLNKESLISVIANFISASSVMGGIKLICSTVSKNKLLNDPINIDDSELAYTIIGGFAIVWIAAWELVKQFKDINT